MTGPILRIRQQALRDQRYPIHLTLHRPGQMPLEAEAELAFAFSTQEQEELRWYLEDYLQHAEVIEAVQIEQIEAMLKQRGEELYRQLFTTHLDAQAIWFAIREHLADLRLEIDAAVVEAAAIPWELLRDPASDSALAVRVREFVRVQPRPNIGFVAVPPLYEGRIRLLYVVCRPDGTDDVALCTLANRVLHGLGAAREQFDFVALRPPTFEQLQHTITDAKAAGRPFHIVHFDGHGMYADS